MDRIEDLLRRIREPRGCVELLLAASREDAGKVARQLAAVLSSLPAVHGELAKASTPSPAVEDLVRRLGGLELLALDIASRTKEPDHGIVRRDDRHAHPASARRLRDVGRLALL